MRIVLLAAALLGTAVLALPASAAPVGPSPALTQGSDLTTEVRSRSMKRSKMRGQRKIGRKKGL